MMEVPTIQDREEFRKACIEHFPIFWRSNLYVYVEKGWYSIIWDCSAEIEKVLEKARFLIPIEKLPYIFQVKEKFGTLRIYYEDDVDQNIVNLIPKYVYDELNILLYRATTLSINTCEKCGEPGSIHHEYPNGKTCYWKKTHCDDCWMKDAKK